MNSINFEALNGTVFSVPILLNPRSQKPHSLHTKLRDSVARSEPYC